MNDIKNITKDQAEKSKNVEQAAALFSRLSDTQKDALIKLVKELSRQNK